MSTKERETVRVSPVHRFESGGTKYNHPYSFSEIHLEEALDEVDSIFDVAGADAWIEDGEIHYQYGDRPEMIVRDDGVYVDDGEHIEEAEKQAYFVLSMMAGSGYVSNWRKDV